MIVIWLYIHSVCLLIAKNRPRLLEKWQTRPNLPAVREELNKGRTEASCFYFRKISIGSGTLDWRNLRWNQGDQTGAYSKNLGQNDESLE